MARLTTRVLKGDTKSAAKGFTKEVSKAITKEAAKGFTKGIGKAIKEAAKNFTKGGKDCNQQGRQGEDGPPECTGCPKKNRPHVSTVSNNMGAFFWDTVYVFCISQYQH